MADLPEQPQWEAGIYQWETTDPVVGGVPNPQTMDGIDNIPTLQLANRTGWLKQQFEALNARSVTAGNGLTGGGMLSADVELQLDYASQAEALAGTDTDHPMNALRTREAIGAALSSATGLLPIGAEIIWTGSTPPAGYLEQNRATLSRDAYPDLWVHAQGSGMLDPAGTDTGMFGPGDGTTTFQLPDMRSEFIRGWDNGRGVDDTRNLGSSQNFAMQNVEGVTGPDFWSSSTTMTTSGPFESKYVGKVGKDSGDNGRRWKIDFKLSRAAKTAAETRPRNVSRMICIRAY